jgi:hypothetical protein
VLLKPFGEGIHELRTFRHEAIMVESLASKRPTLTLGVDGIFRQFRNKKVFANVNKQLRFSPNLNVTPQHGFKKPVCLRNVVNNKRKVRQPRKKGAAKGIDIS